MRVCLCVPPSLPAGEGLLKHSIWPVGLFVLIFDTLEEEDEDAWFELTNTDGANLGKLLRGFSLAGRLDGTQKEQLSLSA